MAAFHIPASHHPVINDFYTARKVLNGLWYACRVPGNNNGRLYHACGAGTAHLPRVRGAVADTITPRLNLTVIAGVGFADPHIVSSRYLASVSLSENRGTSSYRHLYDLIAPSSSAYSCEEMKRRGVRLQTRCLDSGDVGVKEMESAQNAQARVRTRQPGEIWGRSTDAV
jgi:hypothetical protein